MKKYLFLLIGLSLFVTHDTVEAKAFKLGRQKLTVTGGNQVQTGGGGTVSDKCPAGYCKKNGRCIKIADAACTYGTTVDSDGNCVCGTMPPCNNGYVYNGQCIPFCSGVSCKAGYTPVEKTDKCCCEQTPCLSGYSYNTSVNGCIKDTFDCKINCHPIGCGVGSTLRPSSPEYYLTAAGLCPACSEKIQNCKFCSQSSLTDVTCTQCKSGYNLINGKCKAQCAAGYSFNTSINACVKDTLNCMTGCHPIGCGVGSTLRPADGHYITTQGTCPACSDKIAHCTACSQTSALDITCTKCENGYNLKNGECQLATPSIAPGVSFCSAGFVYHPIIGQCVEAVCPINCADMCTDGYCLNCNPGYYLDNRGKCVSTGVGSPALIGEEGCAVGQTYNPIFQTCVSVAP